MNMTSDKPIPSSGIQENDRELVEKVERLVADVRKYSSMIGCATSENERASHARNAKIAEDKIIAALRRGHERGTYCWLIESDHSTYYSGSRYGYEAEHYFFGEPFKAIRYATKAKAEEKIQREEWKNVKAVEHHFDERPPSSEMVMVRGMRLADEMVDAMNQCRLSLEGSARQAEWREAHDKARCELVAMLSAAEAEGRKS